jgi:hypothetical protein
MSLIKGAHCAAGGTTGACVLCRLDSEGFALLWSLFLVLVVQAWVLRKPWKGVWLRCAQLRSSVSAEVAWRSWVSEYAACHRCILCKAAVHAVSCQLPAGYTLAAVRCCVCVCRVAWYRKTPGQHAPHMLPVDHDCALPKMHRESICM